MIMQTCRAHKFARWLVVVVIASGFGVASAAAEPDSSATSSALRQVLDSPVRPFVDAVDVEAIKAFYSARENRPVWVDQTGPTHAGSLLMAELSRAEDWGLRSDDFKLQTAAAPRAGGAWTPEQAAEADLELTGLALRYARHARGGRIPDPDLQLSSYLDRHPRIPNDADVLARLTSDPHPDQVLTSYQPQSDQFQKLKTLYATLRSRTPQTPTLKIADHGPTLLAGMRNSDIEILNRRFGIATSQGYEDVFSASLKEAIKAYQQSISLTADGIVGRLTRQALNSIDGSDHARAVLANMEQWRWMPETLGDRHIFVNVADFAIDFVDAGDVKFHDRVIVGERDKQTPIFSKDMTTIVVRPEWNLPDSIKLSKLLASGSRSLESQGYVIKKNDRIVSSASIDWSKANLSAYRIYQPSGDDNALGAVKFLFPNKHSVYLHDTPSKSLFNASERLFSHGCVRVRNPLSLAQLILNADRGDNAPKAAALARKGPFNNQISLTTPIPVHIGYFTVWVEADGEARFLADPYGHQERISLALENKWNQIDKGEDHLAAVDTSRLKRVALPKALIGEYPFDPPSGVTTEVEPAKYRPRRDSVGDIIRNAITN